ncbi:hypothetical protein GDO86_007254 [Hymenochirus boettgeri]|uniref:Uncharacterized protein n=1 Tax=Hymenochirus boettgeri TaxID=247094 RepID=A0A8T2IYG8_9PIPI|nr:hypothetical protein GDO86_007254 [Hymenochirus boettgeri]
MAHGQRGCIANTAFLGSFIFFFYKKGTGYRFIFPLSPLISGEEVDTTIQSVHLFGREASCANTPRSMSLACEDLPGASTTSVHTIGCHVINIM